MGEPDARFIAAAREGWPRDAARVCALLDEVERLRLALAASEAERHRAEVAAADAKWDLMP